MGVRVLSPAPISSRGGVMANAAGPDPVGRIKAVGVRLSLSGPTFGVMAEREGVWLAARTSRALDQALEAVRRFVAGHGTSPNAASWIHAGMSRPKRRSDVASAALRRRSNAPASTFDRHDRHPRLRI